MADESPLFALNVMYLTYDTFYFIRGEDVNKSKDLFEFVNSNPTIWTFDAAMQGYKCPRTALYEGS